MALYLNVYFFTIGRNPENHELQLNQIVKELWHCENFMWVVIRLYLDCKIVRLILYALCQQWAKMDYVDCVWILLIVFGFLDCSIWIKGYRGLCLAFEIEGFGTVGIALPIPPLLTQ